MRTPSIRSGTFVTALFLIVVSVASAGDVISVRFEQHYAPPEVDEYIGDLFDGYEMPTAAYGVDIYLMLLRTEHPSGTMTNVRVQLVIPVLDMDRPRGVYLFAPGSTGLINPCRASREPEVTFRWGDYRAHVMAYAGQGFLGVLPDYMGFEDWNLLQPYFHAPSEARIIADALSGVQAWLAGLTDFPGVEGVSGILDLTKVIAGYSQGGHAIFAAADRSVDHPEDVKIDGIIGYGPTTGVEELFLEYSQVAPMVVQAYASIYGSDMFDPFQILAEPWAEELAYDTSRQCVGGIQAYYPAELEELYDPDFLASLQAGTLSDTHPDIASIMRQNRTGMTPHGIPALVVQGTNDIVVDRWTQDDVVIAMREVGNPVKYYIYEGARHDTRQIAFDDVVAWIDSLEPREH